MDKTFTELDLDSLEKVTGGATFDFFDEEPESVKLEP